jgi:spermidine synthase
VSREYLPEIACALNHPKVEILVKDGIAHINEQKGQYDIILVDSTEPVGPAVGLFSEEFYRAIYNALAEDGLFVAQTESPFFNADLVRRVFGHIRGIFPIAKLYLANVPTYPSGLWSFTMGSKRYDPNDTPLNHPDVATKYYTREIHNAAFQLPRFVQELLV